MNGQRSLRDDALLAHFRAFLYPREKRRHVSPFLAWVDFHARSRFARSTIREGKWGTTRSLCRPTFNGFVWEN